MKAKANAKQKREADERKRKEHWSPKKETTVTPAKALPPKQTFKKPDPPPDQTPEEEIREFLDYLDTHQTPIAKDEPPIIQTKKKKPSATIPVLNLEDGMPVVSEAVSRMRMGIQEMRVSRIKVVKLIHGYGSTGRGGKLRVGIREELAAMQRRNLIKGYIPGEHFGPTDAASRKLADQIPSVTRDPDDGRMNHGITIVVL